MDVTINNKNIENNADTDDLKVIVKLGNLTFAIPSTHVITIDLVNEIRPVPDMKPNMRGIITWRDKVFPLLDLRKILGMKSYLDEMKELAETLAKRKEDHIKWVSELETCIKDKREFKLQRDPHKCEFGKWYDSFTTEDVGLRKLVKRFEAPHKFIHSIADSLLEQAERGEKDRAIERLKEIKEKELKRLFEAFAQVDHSLKNDIGELFLFVQLPGTNEEFAVCVDSVIGVKRVKEIDDLPQVDGQNARYAKFIQKITQIPEQNDFILLLDMHKVFKGQ